MWSDDYYEVVLIKEWVYEGEVNDIETDIVFRFRTWQDATNFIYSAMDGNSKIKAKISYVKPEKQDEQKGE